MTLLSFGPVLIVMALAIPALLYGRRGLSILGALTITSIGFYFFVNVRDHQDVYVGWRVGHFLFMSAAVVTSNPASRNNCDIAWASFAGLGSGVTIR